MTHATVVAVDPRNAARAARRSAAVAAPLMSIGGGVLLAALTFMDPAKAGSVPEALAGGNAWLTADRVLLGLGLAALTAAAVLAATSLRDRRSRLLLGRELVSDGGYALAVFVLGPWLLMSVGHYRLAADDWARPGATTVLIATTITAVGAGLVGSARHRRADR